MTQFVHLHVHSEYSVVDGTLRLNSLIQFCQADQQPAVALTDQNNLYALVKFYRAARGAGIKPIIGADVWIENEQQEVHRLVLLCQNNEGFLTLYDAICTPSCSLRVFGGGWHSSTQFIDTVLPS